MRNRSLLLTLICLLVAFFPTSRPVSGATEEEKRQLFLQSRGVHTRARPTPTPEPTAAPRATPTPRPRPKPRPAVRRATAVSTPRATPTPTPEPTPEPTPPPRPTRSTRTSRATPTPEPTATPAPARRISRAEARRRAQLAKEKADDDDHSTIVVEKTDLRDNTLLPPPPRERHGIWPFRRPTKYKYLTPTILRAIDQAPVKRNRWRYIVVHNSATRQGSAKAFDYYHKNVRKMPNGLAYHFVIGNGTSTGDGLIEIGSRWTRQINGGHVHSDFLNNISLGICFVGDFDRDQPTKAQLEALDELIRYLRRRVGKIERHEAIIKAHKDINPRPTSCPGKNFPYRWLYTHFDKKRR